MRENFKFLQNWGLDFGLIYEKRMVVLPCESRESCKKCLWILYSMCAKAWKAFRFSRGVFFAAVNFEDFYGFANS